MLMAFETSGINERVAATPPSRIGRVALGRSFLFIAQYAPLHYMSHPDSAAVFPNNTLRIGREAWAIGRAIVKLMPDDWGVQKQALKQTANANQPNAAPLPALACAALTNMHDYIVTGSLEDLVEVTVRAAEDTAPLLPPDLIFMEEATASLRAAIREEYGLQDADIDAGQRALEAEAARFSPPITK